MSGVLSVESMWLRFFDAPIRATQFIEGGVLFAVEFAERVGAAAARATGNAISARSVERFGFSLLTSFTPLSTLVRRRID